MEGLSAPGSGVAAGCGELHNHNVTGRRVREIYRASGGTVACGEHNANTIHTFLCQPHALPVLLKILIRDHSHHSAPSFLFIFCCLSVYVLFYFRFVLFFFLCFLTMFLVLSVSRERQALLRKKKHTACAVNTRDDKEPLISNCRLGDMLAQWGVLMTVCCSPLAPVSFS